MARKKLGESKAKVFCSKCSYVFVYNFDSDILPSIRQCSHPSCFADNYWKRGGMRVMDLATKNKDNDCPDFEQSIQPPPPSERSVCGKIATDSDGFVASIKAWLGL